MSDPINRRRFLSAAALSAAAMTMGPAALPTKARVVPPTSFKPLKQIDAGLLNVGYAEDGPPDGQAVILLHGWPYDIHSYVEVAPLLAARGYRVIVPYLRGYGTTKFLSSDTFRNGQQSVVALDIIALMDALKIQKAVVGGFDWGARTADIMAVLWPERCRAPAAELGWWYQYYFSTDRGKLGYEKNTDAFNKLIWRIVSPKWNFDDATYNRSAEAFHNPDHVAIVIHNYRWRLGLAQGEAKYDEYEQKLFAQPDINLPTITIGSDFDGANIGGAAYAKKFTGKHSHRTLPGIGHNVPQEAPRAFADAIVAAV
jgi:pimeloyl-ACP methyl ester carboxylesterase